MVTHLLKQNPVLKRLYLVSVLIAATVLVPQRPALSQALLPYTLPLDQEQLEQAGLQLASEAAQLVQFQQGRAALSRAQLATQLLPDNANAWGLLGSIYLLPEINDLDNAVVALERAKSLDAGNAPVLFALGTVYFRQEQYLQSVNSLEAGLSLEADNSGALFDLGNAYYKLERYEDAIARYQQAADLEVDFWPAVNNIGLVLYEQGDVDGAIQKWQEALEMSDGQSEPRLAIAVALFARGDRSAAIEMGTEALERDSRYADIDFLDENLWGSRLLTATQTFFELPEITALIAQL